MSEKKHLLTEKTEEINETKINFNEESTRNSIYSTDSDDEEEGHFILDQELEKKLNNIPHMKPIKKTKSKVHSDFFSIISKWLKMHVYIHEEKPSDSCIGLEIFINDKKNTTQNR
jgi:hypothetical protein